MYVGSLRVRLLVRQARTLKDKRQVVRSIQDRMRNTFNVASAEVEAQDQRQTIVLGFATVSADRHHAKQTLEQIVEALRSHPVAEFVDHEIEV